MDNLRGGKIVTGLNHVLVRKLKINLDKTLFTCYNISVARRVTGRYKNHMDMEGEKR